MMGMSSTNTKVNFIQNKEINTNLSFQQQQYNLYHSELTLIPVFEAASQNGLPILSFRCIVVKSGQSIIIFKMMNFQPHQMNNWQLMYFQLLNQYSSLAHNYHQQTENNNALYRELEQAMEEKVALLQGVTSPMPTQVSLPLPQHQEEEPQQASPETPRVTKVKRNVGSIRRDGQKYKCKRHNCDRSYHTLMSLREHLRSQHGRFPKRIMESRIRKDVA